MSFSTWVSEHKLETALIVGGIILLIIAMIFLFYYMNKKKSNVTTMQPGSGLMNGPPMSPST